MPISFKEGDDDEMEEIKDIPNVPARIKQSREVTPLQGRGSNHKHKKEFAEEMKRYLKGKGKILPAASKEGKNKEIRKKVTEEGKGQFIDIKV
ncbi:hypothetical protein DRJ00_02250 [Candidatus Aerophobetes bacterium]|uniref:Uncharacterized protein n=1 Tax=Aerophobetes bacterium TaxID=2030807 RepID=A0A497E576_UNCAE|nr:MAG: hypothetical protein DRJ00_02250 [Candidatus Aerophobetes bacterium]